MLNWEIEKYTNIHKRKAENNCHNVTTTMHLSSSEINFLEVIYMLKNF